MSRKVDAVIAALRTVLQEAEMRKFELFWETHVVNKWIAQLPGGRWGRWRELRLRADGAYSTTALRDNLITHLRATIAYLETNRAEIDAASWWSWPFKGSRRRNLPVIDAEFKEVGEISESPAMKPEKSVRLIR